METIHRLVYQDAADMTGVNDDSVDLVVTSPPYPMIEMWDEIFFQSDPGIHNAFDAGEPLRAFELMHKKLDDVWEESFRVLKPGGIICVNIGDATRTIGGRFSLYPNHSRILSRLVSIGFSILPLLIWRKQTNAPNKFMGSGMLPPGAYVTLEHEYILIARKGDKMEFPEADAKQNRRESAFFWEERNTWFSDVWFDLKGTRQNMNRKEARNRSGAFPFELPYRLIHMFSTLGGTVLDPFSGTGTTIAAAMVSGRNGIGFEIDDRFGDVFQERLSGLVEFAETVTGERIRRHREFIEKDKSVFKYTNEHYGFPVKTRQEVFMRLPLLAGIEQTDDNRFRAVYSVDDFC